MIWYFKLFQMGQIRNIAIFFFISSSLKHYFYSHHITNAIVRVLVVFMTKISSCLGPFMTSFEE